MKRISLLMTLLALSTSPLQARPSVFDSHVHLHQGEASARDYEAQVREAGQNLSGYVGMWFGSPNHALAGDPASIRAGNDSIIALGKKHPDMIPVATTVQTAGGLFGNNIYFDLSATVNPGMPVGCSRQAANPDRTIRATRQQNGYGGALPP